MKRKIDGTFARSKVYGVGIDDLIGSKEFVVNGKRCNYEYYSVWKNMLKRCYFEKGEYKGKTFVCDSWHKLSNFKKWFDENHKEGYSLDKDLYGSGIYSPRHCTFIPKWLNSFIVNINNPCGSYYDKKRNLYQSYTRGLDGKRLNIGRFKTEEEAVFYAKTVKLIELNKLRSTFKYDVNILIGLDVAMENMYTKFILPEVTQIGNCTFLDTGGVFKKYDNGYNLSVVNLRDYCK